MNVAEIIGYQYVQNLALEQRVKALTAANSECGRLLARYRELHGELPPEKNAAGPAPSSDGECGGVTGPQNPTEEGHADGPQLVRRTVGTEESGLTDGISQQRTTADIEHAGR